MVRVRPSKCGGQAHSRQPSHPREQLHGLAVPPSPASTATARATALREALASRVVVADGAMGTMLQAQDPTLDDFQQLEGCNEILNVTRPDIVRSVHEAYFEVGVDCVETNTFGANHSALGEYDIADRIYRALRGRRPDRPRGRRRVRRRRPAALGARLHRPGHQAAHPRPHHVRAPCATPTSANAAGLIAGGADALLVETTQDLLQTKAALIGARRAMAAAGRRPAADLLRSPSRPPAPCCWAPRSAPR